ncbi:MAG TPA: hypothetical protein VLT15_11030 [Acidimicrobiia bacterium]|nr:hypothetical protein [Acidimicrobiia bacterium]
MTSPLLVEKRSQPADVFLSDGRVIEALVFVADVAQTYEGPQTVRDLMDEPGEVLPAVDSAGDFILIHKPAVSAISVLPSDQDLRGFWHESPATLRLAGGHRIDGSLLVEDGSGERLSDVINNASDWIRILHSDHLVWIRLSALVSARSPEA